MNTDLAGTTWIANFVYTRCSDICPMLMQKMSGLQDLIQKRGWHNLKLVTFSADPLNDTPETLKAYGDRFGVDDSEWLLLTGPLEEVEKSVIRGFKITMLKQSTDLDSFSILHGDQFVLVDAHGKIRGYYSQSDMQKLEKGIEQLLRE
ncbi:MAG: SCO family protein [Deltaproteobacteria bacterium]|nr:SCO family protein [Deltaproteobacteria bacterium]